MLKKTGTLSLLSAVVLGVISLPAQADNATVQNSTQQATISGDNNQVIQVINQVNINRRGRGSGRRWRGRGARRQNTAVVQDALQNAVVDGNGNTVIQETNQINVRRGRRRRGNNQARGWRRDRNDERRGNGRVRKQRRNHDDDDD
ncbi:MAG: hypothetical protein F6K19_35730 [Cyanothece sp. SIO1E1]|nr:hypothetical protein [Cyanothece sp. SIO1E1]